MGLLRDHTSDRVKDLDREIQAAVIRLRHMPESDDRQRRLVRSHIDDLLDRRLQLQQDHVIGAHKRLMSTGE